jgi:hypothetical protein
MFRIGTRRSQVGATYYGHRAASLQRTRTDRHVSAGIFSV